MCPEINRNLESVVPHVEAQVCCLTVAKKTLSDVVLVICHSHLSSGLIYNLC